MLHASSLYLLNKRAVGTLAAGLYAGIILELGEHIPRVPWCSVRVQPWIDPLDRACAE